MKKSYFLCVVFSLLLIGFNSNGYASAFKNGGFETGPDPGTFTTIYSGNTQIDGWIVSAGNVDYTSNSNMSASEGQRCIDLNGYNSAGAISQTFDTITNKTYKVVFSLAGNPVSSPLVKLLRVSAANDHEDFTFDTTGLSRFYMGWIEKSMTFKAVGSSTTLTFTSMSGDGCYGPVIDNIKVLPLECIVDITDSGMAGYLQPDKYITFHIDAQNDCNGSIYYRFSYHPDYGTDGYDGLGWTSMTHSEYTTNNESVYSFSEVGKYVVVVWAVSDTTNVVSNSVPIVGFSVNIRENGPAVGENKPYFPF